MAPSHNDHFYTVYNGDEVKVEYSYYPGTPDVWYLRNGDPGYPGDDPEVEILMIVATDFSGSYNPDEISEEEYERLFNETEEDVELMDSLWCNWYEDEYGVDPDDPFADSDAIELTKSEAQSIFSKAA